MARDGSSRRWPACIVGVIFLSAGVGLASEPPCLECHDDFDLEGYSDSVHGWADCTDCHTNAHELPAADQLLPVDCAMCHEDTTVEFATSAHGQAIGEGVVEAPDCLTCHGEIHAMVPASETSSPVNPRNLAGTCGSCHSDPEMVAKFGIPVAQPLEAYESSVHGRALAEDDHAATCNDCHGTHSIRAASDPESTVFHQVVPETCAQCHAEIAEVYASSVHGIAAAHGAREAPVCTDCHGEHRILSPTQGDSPAFATNVPKMTCGRCHSDLRLADKFGIPVGRVAAYEDSYHGLASRSGKTTVAHCGSCHGVHDILPSSDARSHVHKDNLRKTCGQCHPGAEEALAIGTVHALPANGEHVAVYYARTIYLWMIWLTVGGMVLHNLLDLVRKMRSPPHRPVSPVPTGGERMMRGFRIAHAVLIASFALLVYTGFALTYPEAWWARPLLHWEASLGLRGWLHRGAALVMLGALVFHLVHIVADRRARRVIAGMRPTLEDVHEFRERMSWYVGIRKTPPKAPTLGYPEKLEYIALMWGIIVMTVTGFVLWFENLALRWFPSWVGDVATVIHFYEAVLASLAILIWHFYFVIFDPVVYPMDTAWLTGRSAPGRVAERDESEPEASSAAPSRPAGPPASPPPRVVAGTGGPAP